MEVYKQIIGYEGLYEVSNLGNVKSLSNDKTRKEKLLSSGIDKDGYLQVGLYKNGKQKRYFIHRLVAQAFLPNPFNLPEVNHKDEDKSNNNVDNLEWCDRKYNVNYGTRTEKVVEKMSKQVAQYDLSGNLIAIWKSVSEIERQLGFVCGNISKCCLGKGKTSYGYIWKYIN